MEKIQNVKTKSAFTPKIYNSSLITQISSLLTHHLITHFSLLKISQKSPTLVLHLNSIMVFNHKNPKTQTLLSNLHYSYQLPSYLSPPQTIQPMQNFTKPTKISSPEPQTASLTRPIYAATTLKRRQIYLEKKQIEVQWGFWLWGCSLSSGLTGLSVADALKLFVGGVYVL